MQMFEFIEASNKLQTAKAVQACLEEELNELQVELLTQPHDHVRLIKELADVVWCATTMMEKLGYDSAQVMQLLAKNNASKVYLSLEAASDDMYHHHKLNCGIEPFGDSHAFVVVDHAAKIQKPLGFVKLTAAAIDNCKR